MPFCGFNKKMLSGLKAFNEGLVEYGLLEKSIKKNETIEQAICREISDMTRMIENVNGINDSAKRRMTKGLIDYVVGFYMIIRKINDENYNKIIENIGRYFYSMDEKFYKDLEGQNNDMEDLINYLNNIKI